MSVLDQKGGDKHMATDKVVVTIALSMEDGAFLDKRAKAQMSFRNTIARHLLTGRIEELRQQEETEEAAKTPK